MSLHYSQWGNMFIYHSIMGPADLQNFLHCYLLCMFENFALICFFKFSVQMPKNGQFKNSTKDGGNNEDLRI